VTSRGGRTDDSEELSFEGANLSPTWSYTKVRDWILFHTSLSRTALHLYLILRSLILENDKRGGGGLRALTYDELCWLLPGVNGKPTSLTAVKDALRALDVEGLVTNPDDRRTVTSTGRGKIQVQRRYQVHDFPRDDYEGWRNGWDKLDAYRADWRENTPEPPKLPLVPEGYRRPGVVRSDKTAGQIIGRNSGADDGNPSSATEKRREQAGDLPSSGSKKPLTKKPVKKKGKTAPSARSVGDVRSTSYVGSARDASGCAATGKAGSSSVEEDTAAAVPAPRPGSDTASGPELSRDQVAAVRAVEAGLPPALVALLPYGHIPGRNRGAVLEALDSRTPQQLAERAARRWYGWGYATALAEGKLRSAVGVALELVGPTPYCPDPSCEDGVMPGHTPCRACETRRADRRADRLAGRTVPTGRSKGSPAPKPECLDCGRPWPGAVPADGLCGGCREEAAAQAAQVEAEARAVAARLDQANTEWERCRADEAARVAAEEQQHQEAEAAAEDARRQDAEETARERARIARTFPELAAYAQIPQAATAPF